MKLIINAEMDEMEYILELVREAKPLFDGRPSRVGWGWSFGRPGKRSFFIREIKGGFSVSPIEQKQQETNFYSPTERDAQKEASRGADEKMLQSDPKNRDHLRKENGFFSSLDVIDSSIIGNENFE